MATPASDVVKIRAAVWPIVVSNALVVPHEKSVRADVTGFWSVTLAMGTYEVSVQAANGQIAKVTIDVPNDANTYSFDQRVTASLPSATAPVGGAQPTSSPSVLGIIKSDEAVATPIAVTGVFWKTDYAAVRGIANATNNKIAFVSSVDDAWDWNAGSTTADDNSTVLKPDDTLIGNPGRWVKRNPGSGTGEFRVIATRAVLKTLDPSVVKGAMITTPEEAGLNALYYWLAGDASTPDNITIIQGNAPYDTIGRWRGRL